METTYTIEFMRFAEPPLAPIKRPSAFHVAYYCNLRFHGKNDERRFGDFQPRKHAQVVGQGTLLEATYSGSDGFAGAQFASGRPIVVLVAW